MSELHQILQLASELGFSPLNLVLLVMLYFMGAQSGVFPKFWRANDRHTTPTIHDLHEQVLSLKEYFNHETTNRLDAIQAEQQLMHEDVRGLHRKHDEYDKYGIKVREIKSKEA